ncbi:MAG: hypothetical protein A3A96_00705 [Candidatus Zambryskibacteria bacterium RIFCSPLOWO2_01_FULL_39_39]|uniref:PPM-type phosphatase domain-containing protein n=1 Tax=Candidatus Zambryskibacteria bacterium RIFCSPLOWO2_01_FULL_39_39 TaxID=1802758 RepID=A0A1G2TXB9_9BACT|nr:MAG: hypothetical protein A3F20_03275 [Candidatus Zambryskibacteria bacterium RIFCSPHIGHO2_12_FULL_39_21]OHB01946.1 MAG: hypothetical protein A3A96_00705 [Candidatus Zambryskibacteria bacterium RIFCSPLOWO2_01_FULL_39_39]
MGSRILTLSTFQAIRDHAKASGGALNTAVVSITSRQQQIIGTARLMLGLERVDMLATCGYVYLTKHGGFVHIQGDGVVGLKYRDGHIKMSRYEWADNTPFYPSYGEGGIEKFVGAHGGDLEAKRLSCSTVIRKTDGSYTEESSQEFTLREGLEGVVTKISQEELDEVGFVAVFSDGVTQIENVSWRDAVSAFLSFKNTGGEFAKRRMIRGIKDMQQSGKGPADDISYAVVRIDNTEEETLT